MRSQKQYVPMRANFNEGGNTVDQLQEERGNVENVADFATDYEGREFAFNKGSEPPDLREFTESPQQGDLIHSRDEYLYVLGGPQLHKDLTLGWYKSISPAGVPKDLQGEAAQSQQTSYDAAPVAPAATPMPTSQQLAAPGVTALEGPEAVNMGGLIRRR